MLDLSKLTTESRNPDTMALDEMTPLEIARTMNQEDEKVVKAVKEVLPMVQYDEMSKVLSIYSKERELTGCVAVCTGGTSDIPVAEEAAQTAEFLGQR